VLSTPRPDAALARELGQSRDVDDLEHRVGRGLAPDQARVRLHCGFERSHVVEVDETEVEPGAAATHPLEQAEGAAVDVVHADDVAAAVEHVEHGGRGRQARGEGIATRAAFQRRDATLIGEARRVVAA
jgi:hypothetical protein